MSDLRARFEAAKAAKLNGSANSRTAHAKLARAGALKLTVSAGTVPAAPTKGRRREPSMPRVSILDNRPTPERTAKVPGEMMHVATGTRAHTVRSPLEVHKAHLAPEYFAAAARFLKNREAVDTATRQTSAYSGMPGQHAGAGSQRGGVRDARRADAAELAFVEAKIEPEFLEFLELLEADVEAHRHNQPRTLADLARRYLAYRSNDGRSETAAGVGMLWGALVRLASIYMELRAGERAFSTAEEIAARRHQRRERMDDPAQSSHDVRSAHANTARSWQERQRQAATAVTQFCRERRGRRDEEGTA